MPRWERLGNFGSKPLGVRQPVQQVLLRVVRWRVRPARRSLQLRLLQRLRLLRLPLPRRQLLV